MEFDQCKRRLPRRRVLASMGAVGSASLAGCTTSLLGHPETHVEPEHRPDSFVKADGHAFDPPVAMVDPGTKIVWEWSDGDGSHFVVRADRTEHDPESVLDPIPGPNAQDVTFDLVGMYRYACYVHHEEGMRGAVIVMGDETRSASAQNNCLGDAPAGDGIGHTGGDSPWT